MKFTKMTHLHLNSSIHHNDTQHSDDGNYTDCFILPTLETITSTFTQNFLLALYTSTSLLALLGNVIVIIVQLFGREATAQSIRKYLINLAVSDIVLGVLCVPFTYTDFVYRQWIFAHWLCPLAQFVQLLSVFITSISLSIIGIERYLATLHPLSTPLRWLQSHTNLIIIQTWIIGCLYAYIPVRHTSLEQFDLNNATYYQCSNDNGLTEGQRHFYIILNIACTFVVPSLILTFSYLAIMRKLRCDERRPAFSNYIVCDSNVDRKMSDENAQQIKIWCHEQMSSGGSIRLRKIKQTENRSKTIKTMFIIIVLYDVCWFPIKLYQLLLEYDQITFCTEIQFHIFIYAYIVCHWVAMANSFVNPIVYSFTSKGFRNDLRRILIKLILKWRTKKINGEGETDQERIFKLDKLVQKNGTQL